MCWFRSNESSDLLQHGFKRKLTAASLTNRIYGHSIKIIISELILSSFMQKRSNNSDNSSRSWSRRKTKSNKLSSWLNRPATEAFGRYMKLSERADEPVGEKEKLAARIRSRYLIQHVDRWTGRPDWNLLLLSLLESRNKLPVCKLRD